METVKCDVDITIKASIEFEIPGSEYQEEPIDIDDTLRRVVSMAIPKRHEVPVFGPNMEPAALSIQKISIRNNTIGGIERRSKVSHKIVRQFYIAAENLGAKTELLALFGSYGDTLEDEDLLQLLQDYNETGTCMREIIASVGDTPSNRRRRFKVV